MTDVLQAYLHHEQVYIRQRAQIILLTLDGIEAEAIAEQVEVSVRTVQKWQKAWEAEGMAIFPPLDDTADDDDDAISDDDPTPPDETESPDEETEPVLEAPRLNVSLREQAGILSTDPMPEAGRKLLLQNLEQLIVYEPIARLGQDIEGVHKMRVATRRMRSAFDLFGDYLPYKRIKKQARQTARQLGAVRDLDVFLTKTYAYIDTALSGDSTDLAPFLKVVHRQHKKARKSLMKWLNAKDYDRFVMQFYSRLQDPIAVELNDEPSAYLVQQIVPRIVYTSLEDIRAFEPYIEGTSLDTLHALRISFKRLRYVLEFFSEVLGSSAGEVIKLIKQVQDHLGDLNDARHAVAYLEDLQAAFEDNAAYDAYLDFRRQEINTLYASFGEVWARFNSPTLREQLALAVAAL